MILFALRAAAMLQDAPLCSGHRDVLVLVHGPGSDLDPCQGDKARNERTRNFVPLRENSMGGGTMSRDTLLFRVSLIWLAVLTAGCVYMLLTL
jgi:hypothetical protein